MKTTLTWLVLHSVFAASLIAGLVYGVPGATNLSLFIAWGFIAVSWVVAYRGEQFVDLCAKERWTPPAPLPLSFLFDMVVVGFLVWHGYWFTAAFYLVHYFLMNSFADSVAIYRGRYELDPADQAVESQA